MNKWGKDGHKLKLKQVMECLQGLNESHLKIEEMSSRSLRKRLKLLLKLDSMLSYGYLEKEQRLKKGQSKAYYQAKSTVESLIQENKAFIDSKAEGVEILAKQMEEMKLSHDNSSSFGQSAKQLATVKRKKQIEMKIMKKSDRINREVWGSSICLFIPYLQNLDKNTDINLPAEHRRYKKLIKKVQKVDPPQEVPILIFSSYRGVRSKSFIERFARISMRRPSQSFNVNSELLTSSLTRLTQFRSRYNQVVLSIKNFGS